jgi:hypothetical protein
VYPKIAKTDADEPSSNDWQPCQADAETMPHSAKFEIQLARLKNLIAEKDRRIADLEAGRLREDRHGLTGNWQEHGGCAGAKMVAILGASVVTVWAAASLENAFSAALSQRAKVE